MRPGQETFFQGQRDTSSHVARSPSVPSTIGDGMVRHEEARSLSDVIRVVVAAQGDTAGSRSRTRFWFRGHKLGDVYQLLPSAFRNVPTDARARTERYLNHEEPDMEDEVNVSTHAISDPETPVDMRGYPMNHFGAEKSSVSTGR